MTMKRCAYCGHEMTFDRCGNARAGIGPLCHSGDHDCYRAVTVYERQPGPDAEQFSRYVSYEQIEARLAKANPTR